MEFSTLFFIVLILDILLLSYYILILLSAGTQQECIQKTGFLRIYTIISLHYIALFLILSFISPVTLQYFPPIIRFIFNTILGLGVLLFLIYASINRHHFGGLLYTGVKLLTVSFIIETGLLFMGYDGSPMTVEYIIINAIDILILINAFILITIHGFKNDDIYIAIAALTRIGNILYLIFVPIIISFIAYGPVSPF